MGEIVKNCGTCAESRKNGSNTVYCRLYGIYISKTHERNCHRFFRGKEGADNAKGQDN